MMVRLAEKLVTLDPRDEARHTGEAMAARSGGLDGKVLGLLSNNKPNSETLLSMVADLIKDTYELKAVVEANKGTHRIPAPAEIIDDLAERCDVVIVATAE
ncbi:MAG: hypothetical protein IH861_04375 [Chloroflexi bacterium]|nr:hypothetical protein [Chloroflexota bacterium]